MCIYKSQVVRSSSPHYRSDMAEVRKGKPTTLLRMLDAFGSRDTQLSGPAWSKEKNGQEQSRSEFPAAGVKSLFQQSFRKPRIGMVQCITRIMAETIFIRIVKG